MSTLTPILTLRQSAESTVAWAVQQLIAYGFQIEQTFDLHAARMAHVDCSCPYHGTSDCTCQMVVLLVYGKGLQPLTVIAHGYDGQTSLSLVDTGNEATEAKVIQALNPVIENSKI
jgi:hypothetical protein